MKNNNNILTKEIIKEILNRMVKKNILFNNKETESVFMTMKIGQLKREVENGIFSKREDVLEVRTLSFCFVFDNILLVFNEIDVVEEE